MENSKKKKAKKNKVNNNQENDASLNQKKEDEKEEIKEKEKEVVKEKVVEKEEEEEEAENEEEEEEEEIEESKIKKKSKISSKREEVKPKKKTKKVYYKKKEEGSSIRSKILTFFTIIGILLLGIVFGSLVNNKENQEINNLMRRAEEIINTRKNQTSLSDNQQNIIDNNNHQKTPKSLDVQKTKPKIQSDNNEKEKQSKNQKHLAKKSNQKLTKKKVTIKKAKKKTETIFLPNNFYEIQNQKIHLLNQDKNICPNRPRTVYFLNKYHTTVPKELKYDPNNKTKMYVEDYTINDRNFFLTYKLEFAYFNSIKQSMEFNNAIKIKDPLFTNTHFAKVRPSNIEKFSSGLNKYQKWYYYPFQNHNLLKKSLYEYFEKSQKAFPKEYDYMPETYYFPRDRNSFMEKYGNSTISPTNMWMYKPELGSYGRGIFLIKNISELHKRGLVTRYINNPHLVNKRKYHLRVYCLVTSVVPLKLYLCRKGIIKYASENYSNKVEDMGNKFIHITNYDVNKYNPRFKSLAEYEAEAGDTFSVESLIEEYKKYGKDFNEVWKKIRDIFVKTHISTLTAISLEAQKKINKFNYRSFFKLYGADILVDDTYKPWLIEMNSYPTLFGGSEPDLDIKNTMITDALNLLGVQLYNHTDPSITLDKQFEYKNKEEELIEEAMCEINRPTINFERIFPLKDNIEHYKQFIPYPGKINEAFWEKIMKS